MSSCHELFPVTQGSIFLSMTTADCKIISFRGLFPLTPLPSCYCIGSLTYTHQLSAASSLIGATVAIKPNRASGRQPARATL